MCCCGVSAKKQGKAVLQDDLSRASGDDRAVQQRPSPPSVSITFCLPTWAVRAWTLLRSFHMSHRLPMSDGELFTGNPKCAPCGIIRPVFRMDDVVNSDPPPDFLLSVGYGRIGFDLFPQFLRQSVFGAIDDRICLHVRSVVQIIDLNHKGVR